MRPTNSTNSPPVRWSKRKDSSGTSPISLLISSALFGHRHAEQADGAGGGRSEAHQHFNGGGFAGAVGSEEAEKAALGDGQAEAIDGGFVAVDLAEILDLDSERKRACAFSMVPDCFQYGRAYPT